MAELKLSYNSQNLISFIKKVLYFAENGRFISISNCEEDHLPAPLSSRLLHFKVSVDINDLVDINA